MRSTALFRATSLSSVTVLSLLFTAGAASAQTPTQPPPDLPPAAPPPAAPPPVAPAAPATASTLPAAPPARYTEGANVEQEPADEGRLRIGFNLNGGRGSGHDTSGPALSGTFRIGYQFDHLMALYANLTALAWIGSTDRTFAGKSVDLSAIGAYQLSPIFSLTPTNWLELAGGPSLDRMTGGTTKNTFIDSTLTSENYAYSGFYFGLHGRLAFHIGGKPNTTTGRRTSFTIGLDLHPTFAEGAAITFFTVGLGADWY
ncbi:MAG: hypothetical protein JWP97_268 [Labilithrix sp.]|nr:hypothetical protein [Labilithrix sp.]